MLLHHVAVECSLKQERSFADDANWSLIGPRRCDVILALLHSLFLNNKAASSSINALFHRFEWIHVVSVFRVENQLRFAEKLLRTNTACVNVEAVPIGKARKISRCRFEVFQIRNIVLNVLRFING